MVHTGAPPRYDIGRPAPLMSVGVHTPAGERVLATARRVLDELERAEDELRVLARDGSGVPRICTQRYTGKVARLQPGASWHPGRRMT
jgi:hypothetical protein